jgi:outer membrane protein assembly factor BamB
MKTMKLSRRMAVTLVVGISLMFAGLSFLAGKASAGNWPQWRGPDGSGISNEKNLPSEWAPTKNIKWKTAIDGRAHSSPIVWGNRVFLTTAVEGAEVPGAKAAKHLFDNKDFVHPDAIGANHKHTFKVLCLDRDTGKILWEGQNGDLTGTPNVPWKYEKGTAYVPSPILYGDYLYLTTDRGILTAIDAKTGEVKYEGGRIPIPATFTASPVAFEGKILMTSEDGDTFIVKAGPKHEILGTNSVGEPVYASPAIADGRIFIRGEKNLYCIGT